jgi:hypothetical protein
VRWFDVFLSHPHNDASQVRALAETLSMKHGLRVWLDGRECKGGKLEPQCEQGIRDSRYAVVVGSKTQLNSKRASVAKTSAPTWKKPWPHSTNTPPPPSRLRRLPPPPRRQPPPADPRLAARRAAAIAGAPGPSDLRSPPSLTTLETR